MSPTATGTRACTNTRPTARHLLSWGRPGIDPGEFNLPHNIGCDADGWVYVADRENHRIQVFDGNGRFETEWHDVHRPSGLFQGADAVCYVGEAGPTYDFSREAPNLARASASGPAAGRLLARLGLAPAAGVTPGPVPVAARHRGRFPR